MMFDSLLGNEPIKDYLRRAMAANRLHHTLLFSGPKGVGKTSVAIALASDLLASPLSRVKEEKHPDLRVLRPDGKSGSHSIEQLREMIAEVYKPPFEAKRKVFILHDAERMLPTSANALLKTLEEPSLDCTLILLSSSPSEMLPTILSRAVHLPVQPLQQETIAAYLQQEKGLSRAEAAAAARLSNGSLGEALDTAAEPCLRGYLFDALSGRKQPFEATEAIEKSLESQEGIDVHRRFRRLLSDYLMYARDQEVRKEGGGERLLYFPEAPPAPLSLERAERLASGAKDALGRNVKLSACLYYLLSL